ncbi:MAG: hypothetical protein WC873_00930 [Candidatus Gracilibacteria bacterium]
MSPAELPQAAHPNTLLFDDSFCPESRRQKPVLSIVRTENSPTLKSTAETVREQVAKVDPLAEFLEARDAHFNTPPCY